MHDFVIFGKIIVIAHVILACYFERGPCYICVA